MRDLGNVFEEVENTLTGNINNFLNSKKISRTVIKRGRPVESPPNIRAFGKCSIELEKQTTRSAELLETVKTFELQVVDAKQSSVYFDREFSKFVGLDQALIDKLSAAHPRISIESELKRMELWLLTPKGKPRKGTLTFINKWLNSVSEKNPAPIQKDLLIPDCLASLYTNYLQELWQPCQHLLTMNKTNKLWKST